MCLFAATDTVDQGYVSPHPAEGKMSRGVADADRRGGNIPDLGTGNCDVDSGDGPVEVPMRSTPQKTEPHTRGVYAFVGWRPDCMVETGIDTI